MIVLPEIHPDLDLSIGLAPDFESLGPYRMVGFSPLGVLTLLQLAPSSLPETLLALCSLGNVDSQSVLAQAANPRRID